MSAQTSKAARELAIKILVAHQSSFSPSEIAKVAEVCQSHLSDLLTQAQYTVEAGPNEVSKCQHFLAASLEPWKAGE